MSSEDVEVLRGLYARWGEGDFSDAIAALDPQIVFERIMDEVPPGPGGAGSWTGIDEAVGALMDWIRQWDEIHHQAEEFIDLGDRVLVLTRQSARGKLSGVPVEAELADIVTVRDGKIARWEIYWSREEARQQAQQAKRLESP